MTTPARALFVAQAAADADAHRAARVVEFCDQVDLENAVHRTLFPLPYHQAVLVEGTHGVVVVHADTYEVGRVDVEARAGDDVTVTRGVDLLSAPMVYTRPVREITG